MQIMTMRTILAAGVLVSAVSLGTAAQAEEIGVNIFSKIFGGDEKQPNINYSERAPLVVPPRRELRQPGESPALRNPAWPKDPDDQLRQKLAKEGKEAPPPGRNGDLLSQEELAAGRLDGPSRDVKRDENPIKVRDDFNRQSNVLSPVELNRKTALGGSTEPLVAGVEPPRRSLIDPPKGMRAPLATAPLGGDEPLPSEQTEKKSWLTRMFGG